MMAVASDTICRKIREHIKIESDDPIWGCRIVCIPDEEAILIPELGLDNIVIGSEDKIAEFLKKYKAA